MEERAAGADNGKKGCHEHANGSPLHLPRTIIGVDISKEALQRAYDAISS
jgi:hypothetical protein